MAKFIAVITKYEIIQHVVSFAEQNEAELYIKKVCSNDFDPDNRDARVFFIKRDGLDKEGESAEEVYSYHPNDALPPEKVLNKKQREEKIKQEKKNAKKVKMEVEGKVTRKFLVMEMHPNATAQQEDTTGNWFVSTNNHSPVENPSNWIGTGASSREAWRDAGIKLGVSN